MKITGVRWVPYAYDLTRPVGDANTPDGVRRFANLAVFIDTDEGLSGCTVANAVAEPDLAALAPLVVGEDPRAVRGLWQRMVDASFKVGNTGAASLAVAAIDMALWDLRAKVNGVPLWRELGAVDRRVRAYASGLDTPLDDAALEVFYRGMAAQGVTAGKLKVGRDPDADLRRLRIMADALGGTDRRVSLMVDANEYWSPKQAIRRMAEMEREFDILWCEEPARRWDAEGLKQVSAGIRAAVATGENLRDPAEYLALLRHGAVDVVQIGHESTGITGALRVADMAQTFERPVAMMNCPGRFMAHVAAVLPHHLMMEVLDIGRDAVFSHDTSLVDGELVLGEEPGLGIRFDQAALSAHATGPERQAVSPAEGSTASSGRGRGAGVSE